MHGLDFIDLNGLKHNRNTKDKREKSSLLKEAQVVNNKAGPGSFARKHRVVMCVGLDGRLSHVIK